MSIYRPRLIASFKLPFLCPRLHAPCLPQTFRRYESTARRTTKKLRVKPDTSFQPISPSHLNDHVIFNPPSSAPSPYHTPPAFLPVNDPRRTLLSQSFAQNNPYNDPSKNLPPPLRKPSERKYHLKPEDFEEIRRLRAEDPFKWNRISLAKRFDCSQSFIGMVAQASKERIESERARIDKIKQRWGGRKRNAMEDRKKRSALWAMDK